MPPRPSRAASLLVCATLATWTLPAMADDTPPPPKPSAGSEKKSDASPPNAREEKALEAAKRRQAEAERTGQTGLSRRLSALSARWTKVLGALGTAARLEAEAAKLEDERIAVQEETNRLTTLVEQTEARRARALARLQALGLEPEAVTGKATAPTAPDAPKPAAAESKGGTR